MDALKAPVDESAHAAKPEREAWSGHWQVAGCRPVILPIVLLVLHRSRRRAREDAEILFCWCSDRCSARCSETVISSRFPMSSLSLSRSLWRTTRPRAIGPQCSSQTTCALRRQIFGSLTLTNARTSPPLPGRVRKRMLPTGKLLADGAPPLNRPSESRFTSICFILPSFSEICA